MSLSRYKNIAEVVNATNPISAKFFTNAQIRLLSPTVVYPKLDNEKFISNGSAYSKQKVEFHVYSTNGSYLAGSQFTTNYQAIDDESIYFDVEQDLNELGFLVGNYRFVYNVVLDHVGSFSTEKLFVYNISNSRTELILKLQNPDSPDSIKELEAFLLYWAQQSRYFINSYINFGENNLISIANIATDRTQNTVYIKLFEPLPVEFTVQTLCWISELLSSPYTDTVQVVPLVNNRSSTTLQPPQFDVEKLYWKHFESDYKNWTELTSINTDLNELITTNKFRRKYGIRLNIDFSNLSNFIFYSSLQERILNFVYKVELIAWYQEQIDTLSNLNATYNSDILNYSNSKRAILNSFDDFEVFLYYGKDSATAQGVTYPIPPVPKVFVGGDFGPIRWIDWAQTWINAVVLWKDVSGEGPQFSTIDINSPEFAAWKQNALSVAEEFDLNNDAELIKTIPDFIRDNEANSQYLLFVNMVAHYFDTIWLYIKQFNQRYSQQEHPDLGISKDLVPTIIQNLGWKINESDKIKDLWFYLFGLDETAKLTRANLSNNEYVLSGKDYTKAIWKRILLNLPHITKTKGTYRSISALLSAYGIPSSKFFVREFGGPSNTDERPKYKQEKSVSYLNVGVNQGITLPYRQYLDSHGQSLYPNSIYFRFIPDIASITETLSVIFSKDDSVNILFEKSGSTQYSGNIHLHVSSSSGISSASISNVEFVEEVPTSIFLQTGAPVSSSLQSGSLEIYVLQSKYDKLKFIASASMPIFGDKTTAFVSSGSVSLFNNSGSYYLHDVRFWKYPITPLIMESHMVSPLSYHGLSLHDSTDQLMARYVPWLYNAYTNQETTPSLLPISLANEYTSSEYTASLNFSIDRTGSFSYFTEYVKYEIPTIAGNGIFPEKERIEPNRLTSNLSVDMRSELSAYDTKEVDYNKLKVGYSPQFNINEDIFNRFGTFPLDEYIGSTHDTSDKYYQPLFDLSEFYEKYNKSENDIHKYLKSLKAYDFSIFEQIKQVLPAKANTIMGVIVENNELQRLKLKQLPLLSGDVQESDRIELIRSATRTITFSKLNGIAKNLYDVDIEITQTPEGNFNVLPEIDNKFTSLQTSILSFPQFNGNMSSAGAYNSSIRLVDYLGNFTPESERRIVGYVTDVSYSEISRSYSAPTTSIQLGYQAFPYSAVAPALFVPTPPTPKTYYGTLVYGYTSDVSASLKEFSTAKIEFGSNGNFIKKINKGAQHHRYIGCKLSSPSVNTLVLDSPGKNNVFSVISIQSGSTSVALASEHSNAEAQIYPPDQQPLS